VTDPLHRGFPLHDSDPRQLGGYQIIARLGAGGMGTVYLARSASGLLVAVKVIRPELSDHDEFRARFRSEVNRVRQVPPFCTAEVIDADPEHRTPYLVVEYVDGPTLADVVQRQGPLAAGSLHSVAIGVATALTAIHGAGVIHRDLKPRNVLFSLGTPKVIDFGIARALDMTSQHTGTDQIMGTVAYMAPERFDSGMQRSVSPAADIFAWGAVITFAGTGRTPFAADSPASTAARILTQPPDLSGLPRTLREIVASTLAKDPRDRPTAHELLDLLLTAGPPDAPTPAAGLTRRVPTRAAQTRRWRRMVPIVVTALLVVAGLTAVRLAAGPDDRAGVAGQVTPQESASVSAAPSVTGATPVPAALRVRPILDDLDRPGRWTAGPPDTGSGKLPGRCSFDGQLVVSTRDATEFRCDGPADVFTGDLSIAVDVTLDTQATCALIWFRRSTAGAYRLSVCTDAVRLDRDAGTVTALGATPVASFQPGLRRRLLISARGTSATVAVAGTTIARFPLKDPSLVAGQVVLGAMTGTAQSPARVMFARIEIRSL
jgi:predicted Ser/Thr protein kinase